MADTPAVRDEFFEAMLGDFLDESGQLLDRLNGNLLHLDEWIRQLGDEHQEPCDPELLNEMFRAAHSLKGLSAMLGLSDINTLTHKIENVFDAARKHELVLNAAVVELVFQSVDRLVGMVEQLKDPEAPPIDCSDVVAQIQEVLRNSNCERKTTTQADAERALADLAGEAAPLQCEQPPAATTEAEGGLPQAATTTIENTAPVESGVAVDPFADLSDDLEAGSKYLSLFIDEAAASLDELTEILLAAESGQTQSVEQLMCVSHRIKGAAASVGLIRGAKLAHLMEDAMQELLDTGRPITQPLADALLQCVDGLRGYVAGLKNGVSLTESFPKLGSELLRAMKAADQPGTLEHEPSAADRNPSPAEATPKACDNIATDAWRESVAAATKDIERTLVGRATFQPGLALVGLKARLVYEKLAGLGEVVQFSPSIDTVDDLETIDEVRFAITTDCSPDEVLRRSQVAGLCEFHVAPLKTERPAGAAVKDAGKSTSGSANTVGAKPTATSTDARPAVSPPPQLPAKSQGASPDNDDQTAGKARAAEAKPNETLRVDIERLDQLMNLTGQLVISKARFAKIAEQLRIATTSRRTEQSLGSISDLLNRVSSNANADNAGDAQQAISALARRAEQELDALREDLAVLSQIRPTINNLFETIHQLDRVTDALQQSVMDTRMLPIGPLFTRFKRVVRDISRGNGKIINLEINGEKTELDKRMIDELSDPLIHMVRNAADHGIELPDIREAAGKPRQGTITLDAFHRGNTIVIRVSDDGKGLDVERIRSKAIEKGLVSAADAEKLSRREVFQLIWEPGLSTADKVTDISGRGMGMDIVRSKIEELNGTIELDSEPGRGTQVTIKLPLTLAILPSLMVMIDGDVFAMPIEGVQEIVRANQNELFTIQQSRVARVRGRVIGVVDLSEVFTWAQGRGGRNPADDVTLVVVGERGREVGLIVDHVIGEEDIVIKSMAENYRNVAGIAGASILGDGRVSLILDLSTLIEMAAKRGARSN